MSLTLRARSLAFSNHPLSDFRAQPTAHAHLLPALISTHHSCASTRALPTQYGDEASALAVLELERAAVDQVRAGGRRCLCLRT